MVIGPSHWFYSAIVTRQLAYTHILDKRWCIRGVILTTAPQNLIASVSRQSSFELGMWLRPQNSSGILRVRSNVSKYRSE